MNYAIILSGGVGTRLGLDIPKQYYEVNNRPIIRDVIERLEECEVVDGIVIVADAKWQEYVQNQISKPEKFFGFALPGDNRQLSIYSGLCLLKGIAKDEDVVLVQDAARPNTSVSIIENCFCLIDNADGIMPVLPMKDTVYLSEDGQAVGSLLERKKVYAGQAPESFRFGKYLAANEALLPEQILQINGSTEPAIMAGMNIQMIPGDENNFKITTEADLKRYESVCLGRN